MTKGRYKLKITSLLLAIVMVVGMLPMTSFTAFAADAAEDRTVNITGADGSTKSVTLKDADSDGYYNIGNADELFAFAVAVNGGNGSIRGKLTTDIDLESRAWTPITNFSGTFDGAGYEIKNFAMNITAKGDYGLFGFVNDATIKDFTIYGEVESTVTAKPDDFKYGVIADAAGDTTITDVHSYVNFTIKDSYFRNFVGGILGRINNAGADFAIERCSFSGKLNLGSAQVDCTGGIVAYVYADNIVKLNNCLFDGEINSTYNSAMQVGGLLGYYRGSGLTVTNALSIGNISVSSNTKTGALVGILRQHSSANQKVTNNYYLEGDQPFGNSTNSDDITDGHGSQTVAGSATAVTDAQLKSGEVAYKLGSAWGQTISTQNYPVLGGKAVYTVGTCSAPTYSNTDSGLTHDETLTDSEHYNEDGTCKYCGKNPTSEPDPSDITYLYCDENGANWQTGTKEADEYKSVASSDTAWGTSGMGAWYVASGEITISSRITVKGDVHLILADGATLTAEDGIGVNEGNSLTIYGQENGTGTLIATTETSNHAGIGGTDGASGQITINGGTVTATGGDLGAGIGGGYNGDGTVTINGGTVNATGGKYAAGIGGGDGATGTVTISGGTIEAQGGEEGAGIGGGGIGGNGDVTINGGTVNATGGYYAAGIGGGYKGGGEVTISGGTVEAKGGDQGAGIGGGFGAGIGGNGDVTINGGTVTAKGKAGGAGIGGGYTGSGTVTISGNSHVIAEGTQNSGTCTVTVAEGTDYYVRTSADGAFTKNGDLTSADSYREIITAAHLIYYSQSGDTHSLACPTDCAMAATVVDGEACSGGKATCTEKAVCTVCGGSYGEAAPGHNIVDSVCTECKEPSFKIDGQQLNIGGDLSMKYYVKTLEAVDDSKLTMRFIFLGVTTEVKAIAVENENNTYYFTLEEINPQCMGDRIYATLLYQEKDVANHGYDEKYSVEINLNNLLTKYSDDKALVTLINDTLAYGEAASAYKDHNAMTGKDYTNKGSNREIPENNYEYTGEVPDIRIREITVNFGTYNLIKIKYDNGPQVFIAESEPIAAYNFAEKYIFSVEDGFTLKYSINDYCFDVFCSDTPENMKALAKALYNYGVSAKNYNHVVNGVGDHTFTYTDNGDGTHDKACACGNVEVDNEAHTYTYTDNGDGTHDKACACGNVEVDNEAHAYTYTDNGDGTHNKACTACGLEVDNEAHAYTYTDNGDGTHDKACACGLEVDNEAHTLDITTGKCECGVEMDYIATVTDGASTYYANDTTTLNQAVTAILEKGSKTFTVDLPAKARAEMFTAIRRALIDTEGVEDGSINLTLKGVTAIPVHNQYEPATAIFGMVIGDSGSERVFRLASISLPDVVTIGDRAFTECKYLTSLYAPKVQTIGPNAFAATGLTSVELPQATTIGLGAFSSCTSLTTVKLPSATNIGNQVFLTSENITDLELTAEGAITLGKSVFGVSNFSTSVNLVLHSNKKDEVNGTTWNGYAFANIMYPCIDSTTNHTYGAAVNNGDGRTHSLTCTACEQTMIENCHGGEATCKERATCEVCGVQFGELSDHIIDPATGYCKFGCETMMAVVKVTKGDLTVYYSSLEDARSNMLDDATVTLLQNFTKEYMSNGAHSFTVDLNGYNLNRGAYDLYASGAGKTVTLVNTGAARAKVGYVWVYQAGNFTFTVKENADVDTIDLTNNEATIDLSAADFTSCQLKVTNSGCNTSQFVLGDYAIYDEGGNVVTGELTNGATYTIKAAE